MTEKSLKAAGEPKRINNPFKGKDSTPKQYKVKVVNPHGFYGPDGFVGLNGEATVGEAQAKDLVECGYAEVVTEDAAAEKAAAEPAQ